MKKIYLIRHAKSSWKEEGLSDFDRSLNKRGKADAPIMGRRLKEKGLKPDIVLCSPAKRARKTAHLICDEIAYDKNEIVYIDKLYGGGVEDYKSAIKDIDERYESVFLIGHNMTITLLAEYLSSAIIGNMPTCSVVCLRFDGEFKQISQKSADMLFFDFPKNI